MLTAHTRLLRRAAPLFRGQVTRRFGASSSDFLNDSKIPTMHFQDSLPRMPVPALEKTIEKYLTALAPITSPDEYSEAESAAKEFLKGEGPELHAALVARDAANPNTSYINSWWFDMYVSDRRPLPINSNPQLLFEDDARPEKQDAVARAADFIRNSVRFKKTLDANKLTPECFHIKPKPAWFDTVMGLIPGGMKVPFRDDSLHSAVGFLVGAFPLDMSQFKHMFSTTRVPQKGQDVIVKAAEPQSGEPLRVVVQRGNGFHLVDVTRANGSIVPASEIQGALQQIIDAPEPANPPLGVFTTMNRDDWAAARSKLEANPKNAEALKKIDSALFVVCLEDKQPTNEEETFTTMLYGNGRNRWFDKSFSYIFTPEGQVSLNFEHSWGDGVAVLRLCNEVFKAAKEDAVVAAEDPQSPPTPIEWDVDTDLQKSVAEAEAAFDKWIDSLNVCIAKTERVTTAEAKKYKLAGDGLMQMAMQLAHFRVHGHAVSTYESANHAAFKHGRTETIRSATPESLAFTQAMDDDTVPQSEKFNLMKKAIEKHGKITREALMGQGIDRLLFGLRKIAEGEDGTGTVPKLFTTAAHQKWDKIIISTSTLSSPSLVGGGFGPVNDDCYAFGYGLKDDAVSQSIWELCIVAGKVLSCALMALLCNSVIVAGWLCDKLVPRRPRHCWREPRQICGRHVEFGEVES